MTLTPDEELLEAVDALIRDAKGVRRRASVVVEQGARLRDQLHEKLQTEEVTSEDDRDQAEAH